MSWTPEAVVISGYRVPRDIWREGFEFCEEHWNTDSNIPEDWEDYFIDMDGPGGNDNETFFGSIIYTVPEDGRTKEFDTILADCRTITKVSEAFEHIFRHLYEVSGYPYPSYNKYLGVRWI